MEPCFEACWNSPETARNRGKRLEIVGSKGPGDPRGRSDCTVEHCDSATTPEATPSRAMAILAKLDVVLFSWVTCGFVYLVGSLFFWLDFRHQATHITELAFFMGPTVEELIENH